MTGAPSGDTSILDEGSSSKVVRRPGGGVLRSLLRCFALIGLTLVVAAYFASPARGASPLVVLFEAVTADARSEASVAASSGAQHWDALDDAVQIVEMKVVESDGDDDKDPRCDVAAEAALAFRTVPVPSKPERVLRGGLPSDPSCFADGTGLPRGPPV